MVALAGRLGAIGDGAGLDGADFRQINRSGFGDGVNHYAHSMAWFEGRLYVGVTRATMHGRKVFLPRPDLVPWPVDCPDDLDQVDRRTEIWSYDPRRHDWQRVFKSPNVAGKHGRPCPRYIGFRGMAVYQAPSDTKPCLYISTWAPVPADPPDILRSADGLHFASAARPPFAPAVRSFRTLQVFNGRVHTTPTSSNTGTAQQRRQVGVSQDSVGGDSTIYASDNIETDRWFAVNEEGFGERANLTVFDMETFNGRLYAGTVNPRGLQLWRTEDSSVTPYRWRKVLERGAGRGPLNEAVGSLCEFKGALYVGTGIVNGGFHKGFKIGPAAPEILRVWPDDSWDLLMGAPRMSPEGPRYPLSGYSPGFDHFFTGYVWRMCVHEDWLYAGTFSWAMTLPYLPRQYWPEDILVLIRRWGLEELSYRYGGCALWRTPDGERWYPVTRDGFGNPYNWGIRTMKSTEHGLFVGTANPFGPTVAQKRHGEWAYVRNPRGGCEVFLGHKGAV